MTADSEGLTPQSAAGEGNANRDAATQDYLGPEDLDGIPAETAKRLLRAFNRSPSTWVSLIEPDLTTRFIGASAKRLQGEDTSGRHGQRALDRIHPDDIGPLLHAIDQLRAASATEPRTIPVMDPIRYRLKKINSAGWHTVEARVINMLNDPVTEGYVLVARLAGDELDGVDHVLDLLVDDAGLPDVLAACTRLVPHYVGSAAIVAVVDDDPIVGVPDDSSVAHLAADDRWWRTALTTGEEITPLDFADFPDDLAQQGRDEGFESAWVLPIREERCGEVLGCVVVWVRIAIEHNIGVADGLRKAARLTQLVVGEQRAHHALRREASTDPLTRVGNRSALRDRLNDAEGPVAMAMVDLDDFKPINDTYGHDAGDEVLRVVAERLSATVREQDLVVRLGGDEFAIVFADMPPAGDLADRAERLAAAVAQPIRVRGLPLLHVTASVGLGTGPTSDVLSRADKELYRAKRHKPTAHLTQT